METSSACPEARETEYVLCQLLIEGGAGITQERRDRTVAHLKACAKCDADGKAIVQRLRKAVGLE